MDNKQKKRGLEMYLSILNMDKTEFQLSLAKTKDKLETTNQDILETKQLINSLDDKLREISCSGGSLSVDSYQLILRNLDELVENETRLIQKEKELSSEYNSKLKELYKKLKYIDVCNEKRNDYKELIDQENTKKSILELDDLCAQRNWITNKDD